MSRGDDKSFTRGNIQKPGDPELFADIRRMIEETRAAVAATVNARLTILYWRVGKRIREEVLHCERAKYGLQILQTLCAKLSWSHFRQIISLDEYLTALPSREVLQQKLHTAIELSHKRLENPGVDA